MRTFYPGKKATDLFQVRRVCVCALSCVVRPIWVKYPHSTRVCVSYVCLCALCCVLLRATALFLVGQMLPLAWRVCVCACVCVWLCVSECECELGLWI